MTADPDHNVEPLDYESPRSARSRNFNSPFNIWIGITFGIFGANFLMIAVSGGVHLLTMSLHPRSFSDLLSMYAVITCGPLGLLSFAVSIRRLSIVFRNHRFNVESARLDRIDQIDR